MRTAVARVVAAFEGSPFAAQEPSDLRSGDRSFHFVASAAAVEAVMSGQRHSRASKSSAHL